MDSTKNNPHTNDLSTKAVPHHVLMDFYGEDNLLKEVKPVEDNTMVNEFYDLCTAICKLFYNYGTKAIRGDTVIVNIKLPYIEKHPIRIVLPKKFYNGIPMKEEDFPEDWFKDPVNKNMDYLAFFIGQLRMINNDICIPSVRFDFVSALTLLKRGYKMKRVQWSDRYIYLKDNIMYESYHGSSHPIDLLEVYEITATDWTYHYD